MPIPSAITELSQTAGSNSPAGSESPTTADDYIRTAYSFLALLRDGKGHSAEVDLASAGTCDIGGQNSPFVRITGTTAITSFGTNFNGPRFLRFAGALTLTHNAASLILPGAASITTAVGDSCIAIPVAAGWQVLAYQKASLVPGVATSATTAMSATSAGSATSLATPRTISLTGHVTGTTTAFDGSANVSAAVTIEPNVVTPAMLTQPLTGPNVATAAGATSLSLASGAIPSYTRRITLAINGLSLSGSANILLQLGSTTIQTSGYVSFGSRMGPGSTGGLASTTGIILPIASNTETMNGEVILTKGTTGNVWTASGVLSSAAQGYLVSGSVTLAGVLNIMRLFTTNGTDTFAAGTVGAYFE